MPSIFSKIVAGEIPAYVVGESDNCLAFLDAFPLREGHVLVIPKKEVDYIFDLENELLTELNLLAKEMANKMNRVLPCKRIGVAVVGLEVPHAHIHLVPINAVADMNFAQEKLKFTPEEFQAIADRIKEA